MKDNLRSRAINLVRAFPEAASPRVARCGIPSSDQRRCRAFFQGDGFFPSLHFTDNGHVPYATMGKHVQMRSRGMRSLPLHSMPCEAFGQILGLAYIQPTVLQNEGVDGKQNRA